MRNQYIETLRIIGSHERMTSRELGLALSKTRDIVKFRTDSLKSRGLIDSEREADKFTATSYFITDKGRKLLKMLDEPPQLGDFPAARTPASRQPYVPAPIVTRPGALDFLACPSRRGDELKPHSLPISLAGGRA
jgi:DNA-binding MarR family transcriptional regulator